MRAKKSLGQNFLTSRAIAKEIARAISVSGDEHILEIGPGKGMLTQELLLLASPVVAIEKDDRLISELEETFAPSVSEGKLRIVHGDVLRSTPKSFGLLPNKYVVIANIPYYITGALLRYFLESDTPPRALVLMVQKEVADRIVASDGKESILSLSVKAYGTPKLVRKVPASFFSPKPKVASAVISISSVASPFSSAREHDEFFSLVKCGFAHKRKTLLGNLKKKYNVSKDVLLSCNIKENARAEDVLLPGWKCLAQKIYAPR